tara:strand:- start:1247 stop:1369 length:123 start_codon:yes stop_codon:yes gene_type:complete
MGKNKIESSLELLRIMATKFSEEVTKLSDNLEKTEDKNSN